MDTLTAVTLAAVGAAGAYCIGRLALLIRRRVGAARRLEERFATLSHAELGSIFDAIEAMGDTPPAACVLVRTNLRARDDVFRVRLPEGLTDFPWAGTTLEIRPGSETRFVEGAASDSGAQLGTLLLRPVKVPRYRQSKGSPRNSYAPRSLIARNPALKRLPSSGCTRKRRSSCSPTCSAPPRNPSAITRTRTRSGSVAVRAGCKAMSSIAARHAGKRWC